MLRRCGRRLLYVLGLSFPLLTGRPLFLCPHRLMRPQVVFVLGGPGAGKGTQCARIVEVRPGQPAAPCACPDAGPASPAARVCPRLPHAPHPTHPPPPRSRGLRVPTTGAPSAWWWFGGPPARGMSELVVHVRPPRGDPERRGTAWDCFVPAPLFPYILGTKFISRVGWERDPGRVRFRGPQRAEVSVSLVVGRPEAAAASIWVRGWVSPLLPERETGFSTTPIPAGPLNSEPSTNWSLS